MTAPEALPQQQYPLPYPTTMPLEVDSCCKPSAKFTSLPARVNFFLVHVASKGSTMHYKLNSNAVSILIVRDNYLLCFLM